MGRAKDLTDAENTFIIKETAKGSSCAAISRILGRHVKTVQRFLNNPSSRKQRSDKGKLKVMTLRDIRTVKRQVNKRPGSTSKTIFESAGLPSVSKTTRNRTLGSIAAVRSPEKKPPLTKRHMHLRVDWARTNIKQDMQFVLFTDETRATLDGPDGWAKGWVGIGGKLHHRFRRHQGGGGVMVWAGIINNEIVGPIMVREGVKINSANYCQLLSEALLPWLDEQSLSLRKKLVFMQDNAPAHSARATKEYLASLGFRNERLMVWPPNSPDLNPIENLWAIIKRKIYADGKQFTSKQELWHAIQIASRSVDATTIKNLTDSVNERIFDVIRCSGRYIKK
jgi:transposase